jgi:hypothetical protein
VADVPYAREVYAGFDPRCDLDGNGVIDASDLDLVLAPFGTVAPQE